MGMHRYFNDDYSGAINMTQQIKLELDPYYPGTHRDLLDALERYCNHKLQPGGFLTAVLENDLTGACGRADHWNKKNLPDIVGYIYNHLPSDCWGSKERVQAFMEAK